MPYALYVEIQQEDVAAPQRARLMELAHEITPPLSAWDLAHLKPRPNLGDLLDGHPEGVWLVPDPDGVQHSVELRGLEREYGREVAVRISFRETEPAG